MSATYDKDSHSRASSQTHVPDLEKGEAGVERKIEEEVVSQDEVGTHNRIFFIRQLTTYRSHNRPRTTLVQI
jgi:hypothetical protein